MVRSFPDEGTGGPLWDPPRGTRRTWDGRWEHRLPDRDFVRAVDGELEIAAVRAYRDVVDAFAEAASRFRWSQRELARRAGLAQSAVSKALAGSVWPRWSTLVSIATTLRLRLELAGWPGTGALETVLDLIGPASELSGRSVAGDVGIRPNTLYDLRKPNRDPVSATVFALAAYIGDEVTAVRHGFGR